MTSLSISIRLSVHPPMSPGKATELGRALGKAARGAASVCKKSTGIQKKPTQSLSQLIPDPQRKEESLDWSSHACDSVIQPQPSTPLLPLQQKELKWCGKNNPCWAPSTWPLL